MMWILKATQADQEPEVIAVDGDILIGRHQTADIQLTSPDVSRRHAGLSVQQGELIVIDLQSSNGTFVNGERIENDVKVQENDIIRFANIEYIVQKQALENISQPELSVAEQMNEQGMPDLSERANDVQLNREGMPQNMAIPKPAPIPEGVDIHAKATPEIPQQSNLNEPQQMQKNASLGLISVVILIVLAVVGFMIFK